MTVGEFLNLLEDYQNTTTIKNSRRILARASTSAIAESKYICAEKRCLCDEEIKSFAFKDGEIIITIYGEECDECDNCNKPCCYGCPYAE